MARGAYGVCEWIDSEDPAVECARPEGLVVSGERGQWAISRGKHGEVHGLAIGCVQCRDLGSTESTLDCGEDFAVGDGKEHVFRACISGRGDTAVDRGSEGDTEGNGVNPCDLVSRDADLE